MAFVSFLIFGLLIVLSPGADFLLVFKNSLRYGRRAGCYTAIGIALSVTIHVSYYIIGLSQLISANPWLFTWIKYAGAAYLIYLGLTSLRGSGLKLGASQTQHLDFRVLQMLRQGFLCNLLNPKTIVFFISIFSQLVASHPEQLSLTIGYGAYIAVLHGLWFALVAYLTTGRKVLLLIERFSQRINQLCGCGLIGFGLLLSMSH